MENTVLELRGRFFRIEQSIKDYIKKAGNAKTIGDSLVAEVRIVGLEGRRKAVKRLLNRAEYEAKQLKKDYNRKPSTKPVTKLKRKTK